jgi:diguanylate cyclase (GGDEF)-like protein
MKISKNLALSTGLIGFGMVALLDVLTLSQVSFLLLHLVPILFVTWYAGAAWGVFLAVSMSLVQVFLSIHTDHSASFSFYWYLDLASDLGAALLLVWMQSRLKKGYDHADRLARHDTLTKCLNRTGFYDALQSEIDRAKRYGKRFSLVYFDCDNFKRVNDTLGHHVGDALLVQVGSTLHDHVRSMDSVARLGGDEFAILLSEADQIAARQAIAHLRNELNSAMEATNWPVTFSIGVATFSTAPNAIDEALKMADGLMYEVKKDGKNSIVFRSF